MISLYSFGYIINELLNMSNELHVCRKLLNLRLSSCCKSNVPFVIMASLMMTKFILKKIYMCHRLWFKLITAASTSRKGDKNSNTYLRRIND